MGTFTLIRVPTLAAALDIPENTAWRWVREHRLPPFDLGIGRKHRGWAMNTLRQHDPLLAALVESYLAANREESPQ